MKTIAAICVMVMCFGAGPTTEPTSQPQSNIAIAPPATQMADAPPEVLRYYEQGEEERQRIAAPVNSELREASKKLRTYKSARVNPNLRDALRIDGDRVQFRTAEIKDNAVRE